MEDNSYTNWPSMSDKALTRQIGSFIKHHRLQRNKTQSQVADAAAVSRSTLSLLEKGDPVSLNTLIKVLRVLDLLYIMESFRVPNNISPIALAEANLKQRRRARPKQKPPRKSDW